MVHPYLKRRARQGGGDFPRAPRPSMARPTNWRRSSGGRSGVPIFQEQAMKIALDAAKFTPAEANQLRKAMATFRSRGTIELLQDKMVGRMVGARLRPRIRPALLRPDQGLRRIWLSRKPRGELRASGLRVELAQVPLPGGVRGGAAQLAADGLLRAGADRARCAGAWGRGARGGCEPQRLGLHASSGRGVRWRCAWACARSRGCALPMP